MESRKRGALIGQRLPYKYVGGMKYTPEECANLLAERVNQAAYIECIIRRAIAYAAHLDQQGAGNNG